jgi:ABC-2 type transport system ATP-binding protein
VIQVENLTKFYGPQPAVQDVSFQVNRGEILGFLGPNGAGKTTTMRILTCFIPATRGTARIAGYDVFQDSLEVRRRVGYLPEHVDLYGEMKVSAYLDFVAHVKGVPRTRRRAKVGQVMEDVGLREYQDFLVGNLSKGYRQRVGLAQAILGDPEVLVLDEPTVGLDPKQITEIRRLIRSLSGEKTIILSTHILPEVELTCQRVIIIDGGRVRAMDTPGNLKSALQETMRIVMEVDGEPRAVQETLSGIAGVSRVTPVGAGSQGGHTLRVDSAPHADVRREIARAVVEAGHGLLEMRVEAQTLEDIFIRLVGRDREENGGAEIPSGDRPDGEAIS